MTMEEIKTPIKKINIEGIDIFVKLDCSLGEYGGSKLRFIIPVLRKLKAKGYNTVIADGGVNSNFCRLVARICYENDMKSILILRGKKNSAIVNENLMKKYKANLHYVEPEQTDDRINYFLRKYKDSYYITNNHPEGFRYFFKELRNQIDFVPSHIILACGSGNTMHGLLLSNKSYNKNCTDIIGVTVQPSNIKTSGLKEAIKIAKEQGLKLSWDYTAKSFAGLIKLIREGIIRKEHRVLFLHTGGLPYEGGFKE